MVNNAQDNLEDKTGGSGLVIPGTLCRVALEGDLVDPEGFLLPHETRPKSVGGYTQNIPGLYQRILSLVHTDEWEVIARMYAWFGFRDYGRTFRVLTLDSALVDVRENRPHRTLVHGEYLGIVPQSAVLSDVEFTWVRDGKPMNISRRARENWSGNFASSEGYSPIPVNQVKG